MSACASVSACVKRVPRVTAVTNSNTRNTPQVLYTDETSVYVLDEKDVTMQPVEVPLSLFGEAGARFLAPEMEVTVKFLGEEAVSATLPTKVSVHATPPSIACMLCWWHPEHQGALCSSWGKKQGSAPYGPIDEGHSHCHGYC